MLNTILGLIILMTANCHGNEISSVSSESEAHPYGRTSCETQDEIFDFYSEQKRIKDENENLHKIVSDQAREISEKEDQIQMAQEKDKLLDNNKTKGQKELERIRELLRLAEEQDEKEQMASEQLTVLLITRMKDSQQRVDKMKEQLKKERNLRRQEEFRAAQEERERCAREKEDAEKWVKLRLEIAQQQVERTAREERERVENDRTRVQVPQVIKQIGKESERIVQQSSNELKRFRKKF